MSQFNIDEIEKRTLSGLKDFQRATVERVDYLFRHNQNRVLVADEVGMGKTLIARGAIVKTARLRIEEKDDLFRGSRPACVPAAAGVDRVFCSCVPPFSLACSVSKVLVHR